MSESMNADVARHLSESEERDARRKRPWQEPMEIVEVIMLAIVAVGTAWSGYQAARWDGRQSFLYGTASRLRIEADAAATLGGQALLFDAQTFNSWLDAHLRDERQLESLYVKRFSPEYRVAFDAWIGLHPFSRPDAPAGPAYMPEYHNPQNDQAAQLNDQAGSSFDEGTSAREAGDKYVRQTVLFATVLFLVAIAQRFRFRAVRIAASAVAAVLLVVALGFMVTLPRI